MNVQTRALALRPLPLTPGQMTRRYELTIETKLAGSLEYTDLLAEEVLNFLPNELLSLKRAGWDAEHEAQYEVEGHDGENVYWHLSHADQWHWPAYFEEVAP